MGCICGKREKPAGHVEDAEISDELMKGTKAIFWVIGGPGSGKGTQCSRLSQKYHMAHLSSGDLLRAEVARDSKLGQELNEMMLKGELVPREVVLDLLKSEMIKCYPGVEGYLIDGYPREAVQGQDFEEKIGRCSQIIYISCSDETMKSRLHKRAQSSGRVDDNEETIEKRLKVFHDISEPVMKEYEIITSIIPGDKDPESVFNDCCKCIEKILNPKPKFSF